MELLVFGHAGLPCIVFPTSCGRFFEFEDRDMVASVRGQIEAGEIQLFCVDSVDAESWYNRDVPPRWRIARHMQYEAYVMNEVVPFVRNLNWSPKIATVGTSFGGFHAASMTLRHPEVFSGFLSMGGAFDVSGFLRGYYDQDCYFHLPTHFLPGVSDPWLLDRYRHGTYILATGRHDQCWEANEQMAAIMRSKGIPCRLDVWDGDVGHDWPWWRNMVHTYL
jgi:esterase/lipase superfamily enzyme